MSCLFNSISHFVDGNGQVVRQKICDYLQNNNKIIDGLDTKFILDMESKDYVKKMRLSNTWGGAIEIQGACNIWKLKIVVKNIKHNKKNNVDIEFLPVDSVFNKTIHLTWSGGHYEPVR